MEGNIVVSGKKGWWMEMVQWFTVNQQNTKVLLLTGKEKGKELIILVMVELGKDNGCIIFKMDRENTDMRMEQSKLGFGVWDKESMLLLPN